MLFHVHQSFNTWTDLCLPLLNDGADRLHPGLPVSRVQPVDVPADQADLLRGARGHDHLQAVLSGLVHTCSRRDEINRKRERERRKKTTLFSCCIHLLSEVLVYGPLYVPPVPLQQHLRVGLVRPLDHGDELLHARLALGRGRRRRGIRVGRRVRVTHGQAQGGGVGQEVAG